MLTQETRIYFTLLAGIAALLFLMAFFIVTIVRYHRKRSDLARDSFQQQFQYLEADKERIAADLHDDFGASLSAIKLRLQSVEPKEQAMQKNLDFAEEQIDMIMHKLRNISQHMMPSILKRKGLRETLKELTGYMIEPTGIKVHFEATGIDAGPDTEVHLYRIVQEILNNIIKHSGATIVRLHLKQENGRISLEIEDNGVGFKEKAVVRNNKGTGIRNILARVKLINAKIYLRAKPGKGVYYNIETDCNGATNHKSTHSR